MGSREKARAMKIALLTSDRERCGIARYSRDLLAALQPLVDVDLMPIDPWPPEGERLERLRAAEVVHLQHEYSFWGTAFPPPRAYYEGLERFRRPGRLVITAHTVADAETVVAARGGGVKPRVKRLALRLRPGVRDAIESGPFQTAARVIVHSPAAAASLGKRLGLFESVQFWPMPVPEWSVPPSEWAPLARRLHLEDRRLITVFGFVTPEKDYELATMATALAREPHPDLLIVIAGAARTPQDEAYLLSLRKLADLASHEYSTEPFVRFTGFLSEADARALLEHSSIALLPYRSATGSYAASMALAAGCPLVSSDLPAFADPLPAVRYPVKVTCPHLLVNELAAIFNSILEDEEVRVDLARRSREYAAANSWVRAAERHVALYRELIG
jgi:glycosyltransferase involved in cell wall biosynthesis